MPDTAISKWSRREYWVLIFNNIHGQCGQNRILLQTCNNQNIPPLSDLSKPLLVFLRETILSFEVFSLGKSLV